MKAASCSAPGMLQEAREQSPLTGAVWGTLVFAQLRQRERLAGCVGSPFFWRGRTRWGGPRRGLLRLPAAAQRNQDGQI